MIIFEILVSICVVFLIFYVVIDLLISTRNVRYQKLWRLKKSTLLRIDPAITNAELCEQYVIFCKKNGCKVEF